MGEEERKYPVIPVHKVPRFLRDLGVPQWFNRHFKDAYDTANNFKNSASSLVKDVRELYKNFPRSIEDLRHNLYDNINPSMGYINPVKRVYEASMNMNSDNMWNRDPISDEAFATYLQIPKNKRKYNIRFQKSRYIPTKGSAAHMDVYSLPLKNDDEDWGAIIRDVDGLDIGKSRAATVRPRTANSVLGNYTVSHGYDNRGEYVSYYDDYDLNPYRGFFAERDGNNAPKFIQNIGDLSIGIGKPFSIYDRMYLDDYYGVLEPTHSTYLPEVTIKPRKK